MFNEIIFKEKDRITIHCLDNDLTLHNQDGTVISIHNTDGVIDYGIKLDNPHPSGHTLGGLCKEGYGLLLPSDALRFHKKTPVQQFTYVECDGKINPKTIIPRDFVYETNESDKADYMILAYDVNENKMIKIHPKRIMKWL